MVAFLSQIKHLFPSIISTLISCLVIRIVYSNISPTIIHDWNIPLPQILHKQLDQSFINGFDEVVVIGDVHGCYDELMSLLKEFNDNKNCEISENNETDICINSINDNLNNDNNNRILKIFVGDLVNKGPKSAEVVEYLINNRKTCLSVRGNHDEFVIREYLRYKNDGEQALSDKNKWIIDLSRSQIDYLISLPYTISIRNLNAIVVHAGLVPGVPIGDQKITDMVSMRNIITNSDNQISGTSVDSEGDAWVDKWRGPEHIYFGHDVKRQLQLKTFGTGLDTGCVYGNALTAIFIKGLRKGNLFSVKANKVHCQPKINTV